MKKSVLLTSFWLISTSVYADNFINICNRPLSRGLVWNLGAKSCEQVSVEKMSSITSLSITDDSLSYPFILTASTFEGFNSLKELVLVDNGIRTIEPGAFNGLHTLEKLTISYNEISVLDLNVFQGLDNLKELRVTSNFFTNFNRRDSGLRDNVKVIGASTETGAFEIPPINQYAEKYCLIFSVIEKEFVGSTIRHMEKEPYPMEEILSIPVCWPEGYNPMVVKSPIGHIIADDPSKRVEFLKTFWLYYTKKRKQPELFMAVVNAKNTEGETLLDYIETQMQEPNYARIMKDDLAQIISDACSHGGVYSRYAQVCDQAQYSSALQALKSKAENGDTLAQKQLAEVYDHGLLGLKKDINEAIKWYTKVALKGDKEIQSYLGEIYKWGKFGISQNGIEAIKWYKMRGDSVAYYDIGNIYLDGTGIPKNIPEAYVAFRKSFDMGQIHAAYRAGECLIILKDYAGATEWLSKSINMNSGYEAPILLGLLYSIGGNNLNINYEKAAYWFKYTGENFPSTINYGELFPKIYFVTNYAQKNLGVPGQGNYSGIYKQALREWDALARKGNKDAEYVMTKYREPER